MKTLYAVIMERSDQQNPHGRDNRIFDSELQAVEWAQHIANVSTNDAMIYEIPASCKTCVEPER